MSWLALHRFTSVCSSSRVALLAASLVVTGCPDDEASPSDTEGTGSSSSGDGGSTAPQVTGATPGTTDDTTGTATTDGTTTSGGGGSTSTGEGGSSSGSDSGSESGSSSSGSASETSSSGSESGSSSGEESSSSTGSLDACVDEDLGSTIPQTVNADTSGAGDDIATSCGWLGANGPELVYQFTAPATGTYVVDTEGSAIDTILAAYDECGGTEIACNEDGPGEIDCGGVACSRIVLALEQDETLLLVVDGPNPGAIVLDVDQAPPPPATGYGDCLGTAGAACQPGEECITAGVPVLVGVCAYDTCVDATGCPPAPATGDAVVACLDVTGTGSPNCVLDCSGGQTCPDGLACHFGICVAEAPANPGTCCDDSTGGTAGTGTPGCDTTAYEYCVCELIADEPFCCDVEWDAMCADAAEASCSASCPS